MSRRSIVLCAVLVSACLPILIGAQAPEKDRETTKGTGAKARQLGATEFADEPYVIEKAYTKARFESDGRNQRDFTASIRVQSEAAVKQLGLLVYSYMGSFEKLDVLYVRVRKPDGTVVETPARDVQELDSDVSRAAPMYTDQKEKHVAVKALAAGDVLEYALRWTAVTPIAPGHFWFADSFVERGICLEELVEIDVPRELNAKVAAGVEPVIKEEGNRRIYTIRTSRLKDEKQDEAESEDWMKNFYGAPPPEVQVSSFASWAAVGAWYGQLQKPRIEVTAPIRAKAEELVSGKSDETEKAQAIYKFVATRIRYIGVDLGMGRYTPHAAEDVLNNRYGDCKDKHALFAALLEAVGIKVYPALISTTFKIEDAVASPNLLNHVISALPQKDGSYLFLDTTPEVAPFGLLLPGLRNRSAVVVPESGEAKLVKTPADPPFPMLEKYRMDASIKIDGTLDGKGSWEERGDGEVNFRAAYRNTPQNRWQELAQQVVARLGFAGTVSDVAADQPENTEAPFHTSYAYHREKYADWENHRIILPFPPIILTQLTEKQKKAKDAIPLGTPQELVYEASLKLPAGVTPQIPGDVTRTTEFAEYTAKYSFQDGVIRGSRRLMLKAREVPEGQRGAWSSFVKAIQDDAEKWIYLTGEFGAEVDARKGMKLLQEGKAAEAVEVLKKQAEENPDNAWYKLMLGRAYLQVPDEVKAMDLFHEMLNDKEDPAGMMGGVAYELARANRRVNEALDYANKAVALTEADTMKATLDSTEKIDYRRMTALAAQWDALGLAYLRVGDTTESEKYLLASWLLWQRAAVGEHLVELYEKVGKKNEARTICNMALDAPGKDDEPETRKLLQSAQYRLGVMQQRYTVNAKDYKHPIAGGVALSDLRMTKLPMPAANMNADGKNATFALAFENGHKEVQVKFISGAEELKEIGNGLATAKYQVSFPDDRPTRILRQGLMSCSKYTKECTIVLFPMENTPGMF